MHKIHKYLLAAATAGFAPLCVASGGDSSCNLENTKIIAQVRQGCESAIKNLGIDLLVPRNADGSINVGLTESGEDEAAACYANPTDAIGLTKGDLMASGSITSRMQNLTVLTGEVKSVATATLEQAIYNQLEDQTARTKLTNLLTDVRRSLALDIAGQEVLFAYLQSMLSPTQVSEEESIDAFIAKRAARLIEPAGKDPVNTESVLEDMQKLKEKWNLSGKAPSL